MHLLHRSFYLLIILLTLAFDACRSPEPSIEKKDEFIADFDLEKIRERGYIIVSMDNNSTGYFIYRGRTMGYEYELLKRFADEQDLELRIDVTKSLKEAFDKLNRGDTDILAYNLTVTKERKLRMDFTKYHNLVRQVLVQRKPEGWKKMHPKKIDRLLLRNPVDLIDKTVYVRHHSAHKSRMDNLSEEIGGEINVTEGPTNVETEELMRMVANGEIEYTVAEEDVALVNASFYPNLDVKTAVSFPQQIAWGIRKNADSLNSTLDQWIVKMKKHPAYHVIYNRYFKKRHTLLNPESEYFTFEGGEISPYDDLLKEMAVDLEWDWRLLAAQMYKESKFNPRAVSWAGARGLMQLMPNTAQAHGVTNPSDPKQNINAGKKHLKWLQNIWKDEITDPTERSKFVLASYNVGQGHVQDAVALARRDGFSGKKWDGEVEEYLLKKSKREFYNDPIVKYGYCRGTETVNYVSTVFAIYQTYQKLVPDEG
ncbi:MAG: transporter substrate-binding domain-containing protein [Cytophagales bacterium]|nr:transporter substrate-binding domain-containing protein [Cytophagales bacterium]